MTGNSTSAALQLIFWRAPSFSHLAETLILLRILQGERPVYGELDPSWLEILKGEAKSLALPLQLFVLGIMESDGGILRTDIKHIGNGDIVSDAQNVPETIFENLKLADSSRESINVELDVRNAQNDRHYDDLAEVIAVVKEALPAINADCPTYDRVRVFSTYWENSDLDHSKLKSAHVHFWSYFVLLSS
jgi:hypothetical protein